MWLVILCRHKIVLPLALFSTFLVAGQPIRGIGSNALQKFEYKKYDMQQEIDPGKIPAGVVGLGLMGCSITTCLLMAHHPVTAIAPVPADLEHAEKRIRNHLIKSQQEGLIEHDPEIYLANLVITEDYEKLKRENEIRRKQQAILKERMQQIMSSIYQEEDPQK